MIFILTTNALDPAIACFTEAHPGLADQGRDNFREAFEAVIRSFVVRIFSDSLARRIDDVIPFLTFSKDEQQLVAESLFYDLAGRYRQEPEPKRHVGHIRMNVASPAVFKAFAKYYSKNEGASSIRRIVDSRVGDKVCREWLSGKLDLGSPGKPKDVHVYPRLIERDVVVEAGLALPDRSTMDKAIMALDSHYEQALVPAGGVGNTAVITQQPKDDDKDSDEEDEMVELPKLPFPVL